MKYDLNICKGVEIGNNNLFHINWNGVWLKIRFLPEKSALSDEFQFLEDYIDMKKQQVMK